MSAEEDLRRGLLSKKTGFDKLYEDCVVRIQRIKQKNDVIQRQIGTDIEDSIRIEVNNQRIFLEVLPPLHAEGDQRAEGAYGAGREQVP